MRPAGRHRHPAGPACRSSTDLDRQDIRFREILADLQSAVPESQEGHVQPISSRQVLREKRGHPGVHFDDIRFRILGELAMICGVSDICPHRQSLLDQLGVDAFGRQLLVQGAEIILLSDSDAPLGGYHAETLFQHRPAEGGCGVLVLVLKEVTRHVKEIREHIRGNKGSHVRQESVLKILLHSPQNTDSGFHAAGEPALDFSLEADNVCVLDTEEVRQERKALRPPFGERPGIQRREADNVGGIGRMCFENCATLRKKSLDSSLESL